MKKLLIFTIGIVSALSAFAGNTLTLTPVAGHPGDEVNIEVALTNTDAVSSAQIEIDMAGAMTYVNNSAVIDASRADDHQLSVSVNNGRLRLLIYSLGLKAIRGGEGALCSFSLKLGQEPGTYNLMSQVKLTDSNGTQLACNMQSGVVQVLCPKIEVSSSSLDFGSCAMRGVYTRTLMLSNVGNEPLTVSNIRTDNDAFACSAGGVTIEAGASRSLTISCNPVSKGKVSSQLLFDTNAVNGSIDISLSAEAYAVNELHMSAASGKIDEVVTLMFDMNNMEPIAAVQFTLQLPEGVTYVEGSARSYHDQHAIRTSISNNTLKVMMYAVSNATIAEGDGHLASVDVRLSGSCGTYMLEPTSVVLGNAVLQNVVSASTGNTISLISPAISVVSSLDMGMCETGRECRGKLQVANTGSSDLVISRIVSRDENVVITSRLPMTIAAGESRVLSLVLHPEIAGSYSNVVNIYSNDPDNRMTDVCLTADVFTPNKLVFNTSADANNRVCTLNIGMENTSDIVAVQADIRCLNNMQLVPVSQQVAAHSVVCRKIDDRLYRLMIYDVSNSVIEGNNDKMLSLQFQAESLTDIQGSLFAVENIKLSDVEGVNRASVRSAEVAFTGSLNIINPPNPAEPYAYSRIKVSCLPVEAGRVSGAGSYVDNTRIYINTSASTSGYVLKYWTRNGERYSDSSGFYYTTDGSDAEFVAHYDFDPTNPSEPSQILRRNLYLDSNPSEGVSFNTLAQSKHIVGTSVYLQAYCNDAYQFIGWYKGDMLVSSSVGFNYTIPDEDVKLTARYVFNPGNPADPPSQQPETLTGDVDGDGRVTVADAMRAIDVYLNGSQGTSADLRSDVDQDGRVTVADAMKIINIYLTSE